MTVSKQRAPAQNIGGESTSNARIITLRTKAQDNPPFGLRPARVRRVSRGRDNLIPGPPWVRIMTSTEHALKIAVLDDYQGVALTLADWSAVAARADVTVFNDHLAETDAVVERLLPFDVVCVMRERTPLRRIVIERLPKLKLIASTGKRNASIDADAAAERGISIVHTSYTSTPTIELTWALILADARHLIAENASLRAGGWQRSVGEDLAEKTLGIIGLGSIGSQVAKGGVGVGMK